ncbi:lipopolysaccharide biosynthesis protein [Agromyces intestinalis]|uniref:lipopolysaccharide biosynthesis protein n=1 Tax=Agromyces intestinalis TaxID=2592652 RepID=UPI00143DD998|nr:lipopolysaccharide biosynthesis protein [Agromyces intestinalis]
MTRTDKPEPGRPSLRRQAARGSAILLAAQAAKVVIAVVSVVVLSRLIEPSAFGLVVMVTAISGVASIFLDFGLSTAALRSPDITHQQQSNLFWINAGTGLVLAATVFAFSWAVAGFYGDPRLVVVTQWLSLALVLGGVNTQFRITLNRAMRFGALAIGEVAATLFGLAAAVVVALFGYGIAALVVQTLATSLVILVFNVAQAQWWPKLPHRDAGMRALVKFGAGMAATQLLWYATRNIDSIAIGRVWGPTELGLYDRAFRLAVAPILQVNQPMTKVALPVLSRHLDNPTRYMAALREGQLIACYLTSSVLLVLAGVAGPLVNVLLGPAWTGVEGLVMVLAVGSTFRAIQQVVNWLFISKGLSGSLLRLNLWMQPLTIGFILAGVNWGAMGVAVGGTVGFAVQWVASFMWAARAASLDLRPLFFAALKVVATFGLPAGALAFMASTFIPVSPIWQLLAGLALAAAWFAAVGWLSRTTRSDLTTLWRFIRLALGRRDSPST